jgi:hypothetical protein
MGARRNLTIGVTINLEHYENLRVEVNGEAESAAEADSLIRFLDEILGRFGQKDPATRERVDSYRQRVLPDILPEGDNGEPVNLSALKQPLEKADACKTTSSGTEPVILVQSSGAAALREASSLSCENCGGGVSTAEQKMSQLFTGKTLCRGCIKKVQG